MNLFLWLVLAALLFIIAAQLITTFQLASMRRSGLYPQRGKATMADVERLLDSGARVWALRCYREIHRCSLRQAKEQIDALLAKP